MAIKILTGDCNEWLAKIGDRTINCCVTSPPYFGLRDYGVAGQLGLEQSPAEYVAKMVEVFREVRRVRRVLRDDGTLWLNLGDSYAGSGRGGNPDAGTKQGTNKGSQSVGVLYGRERESAEAERARMKSQNAALYSTGIKPKDLIGIPWRVAFALQADGWYLRQDIIWHKPNPMPESVRDRCTKAHEYIFLFSKSEKYHFDSEAIAEPVAASSIARLSQPNLENQKGSSRVPGKTNGPMKAKPPRFGGNKYGDNAAEENRTKSGNDYVLPVNGKRNRRSVWTVTTKPFKEAHFATFPPDLIEQCIKAGCMENGVVLDPFGGAGTTGLVARNLNRHAVLIELNPDYVTIANKRLQPSPSQTVHPNHPSTQGEPKC